MLKKDAMKLWLGSLGLLIGRLGSASGQIIGEEICACSPSYYEFTLDFDLFCPPVNVTKNDAVDDTSCVVTPFSSTNVTDLVPVVIETIDILELGQGLRILVQENIAGTFLDGDTFNYTSITANPEEITDTSDMPRGIQINLVGSNRFGEPLINVFILTFTNNCGAYPVLTEGQSAGWTTFTALEPPLRDFCPFGKTEAASFSPTDSPTATPNFGNIAPSQLPTDSPVTTTAAPAVTTDRPTATPAITAPSLPSPIPETLTPVTDMPVTDSPVNTAPTETSGTSAPTSLPTVVTEAPTAMSVSMSMSMQYGDVADDYSDVMEEFGLTKKEAKTSEKAKLYKSESKKMVKKKPDSKSKDKLIKKDKKSKSSKKGKKATKGSKGKGKSDGTKTATTKQMKKDSKSVSSPSYKGGIVPNSVKNAPSSSDKKTSSSSKGTGSTSQNGYSGGKSSKN